MVLQVGCWVGRITLVCTMCGWQDPPADSLAGRDARELAELVAIGLEHAQKAHGIDEIRQRPIVELR